MKTPNPKYPIQTVFESEIFSFSISTHAVPRMQYILFIKHWERTSESMDKYQTQK